MASKRDFPIVPIIVAALLLGLIAAAWWATLPPQPVASALPLAEPVRPAGTAKPLSPAQPSTEATPEPVANVSKDPRVVRKLYRNPNGPKTADQVLARLDEVLKILETGTDEEKKQALNKLEEDLWSAPNAESILAIRQFLLKGSDAATGEGFLVGEKGILEESPTLRVFLLDQLGSLGLSSGDRTPVQMAREMLSTKKSADEWAVSLRNVTWFEPENKSFVGEKVREMLDHEPWIQAPSNGLLESFDGIVFSKDVSAVPKLANFVKLDENPLQQATFVAMDRLAEVSTLEVMNYLNANPSLFSDRPLMRADYYTAADLSNPAQLRAVETYLSRPDVSQQEKVKLLGGLTTPGSFVSDNLFTEPAKPPTPEQDARRADTLQRVGQQWLQSGRFPTLGAELQEFIQDNAANSDVSSN